MLFPLQASQWGIALSSTTHRCLCQEPGMTSFELPVAAFTNSAFASVSGRAFLCPSPLHLYLLQVPWRQPASQPLLQPSSVQFSHSVVSDSLWPQGLQHARLPCPPPTPGTYSNSCPLHWWRHPTISSSVRPATKCRACSHTGESIKCSFSPWMAGTGARLLLSIIALVVLTNTASGIWISFQTVSICI